MPPLLKFCSVKTGRSSAVGKLFVSVHVSGRLIPGATHLKGRNALTKSQGAFTITQSLPRVMTKTSMDRVFASSHGSRRLRRVTQIVAITTARCGNRHQWSISRPPSWSWAVRTQANGFRACPPTSGYRASFISDLRASALLGSLLCSRLVTPPGGNGRALCLSQKGVSRSAAWQMGAPPGTAVQRTLKGASSSHRRRGFGGLCLAALSAGNRGSKA